MYGKHFESMYEGSMYGAGLAAFAVWGYVISHVRRSRVELNPRKLADTLGAREEEIVSAIKYLSSPDERSRNKEHEGRRLIKEGEFQYFVTGYIQYSQIRNNDDRRLYNKLAQRKCRAKKSFSKSQPSPGEDEYVEAMEAGDEAAAQQILDEHTPKPINPIAGQALQIYEHYPLKVGRPKALKAIIAAIKKHGFEFVEAKTKEYAAARTGNKDFIPHPATWFNQERYNDDPSTWIQNENSKGTNAKGFDRNKGTFSEGIAHIYKAKPIPPTKPPV